MYDANALLQAHGHGTDVLLQYSCRFQLAKQAESSKRAMAYACMVAASPHTSYFLVAQLLESPAHLPLQMYSRDRHARRQMSVDVTACDTVHHCGSRLAFTTVGVERYVICST